MKYRPFVLIVEDGLAVALDMRLALEKAGYIVLGPATSYERAMELIDAFRLDVVLLDIDLSGRKRGLAIAGELLKRHIPALFVSAVTPNDPEARQSEVGTLSKLISAQRLMESLRSAQEISTDKAPTDLPPAFEQYHWRPDRNRKDA